MSYPCDLVTERVALGEPLGELAEHAASCARCRRLAALPAELGVVHRELDPGLGFTARMTIGAQQRLAARRRHRRVAVGAAAAVAVAAGAVLVVTRSPSREQTAVAPPPHDQPRPAMQPQPQPDQPGDSDADLQSLVQLSDTERAMHVSARWDHITKPLAPYRALVKGITP
ncbi:MAG: hypothetical protein ACM31C_24390 [Acidobacteriota bacterium]